MAFFIVYAAEIDFHGFVKLLPRFRLINGQGLLPSSTAGFTKISNINSFCLLINPIPRDRLYLDFLRGNNVAIASNDIVLVGKVKGSSFNSANDLIRSHQSNIHLCYYKEGTWIGHTGSHSLDVWEHGSGYKQIPIKLSSLENDIYSLEISKSYDAPSCGVDTVHT